MSFTVSDFPKPVVDHSLDRGEPLCVQLLKLDHLGEFIAVNIYRAQLRVCRVTAPSLVPILGDFLAHETRHMAIFAAELAARRAAHCKAFALFGFLGFLLGFFTALCGKRGVMACTAAVETVVLDHLQHQLDYLRGRRDTRATNAIEAILKDEVEHRDKGAESKGSLLYSRVYAIVAPPTAWVIKLGKYL